MKSQSIIRSIVLAAAGLIGTTVLAVPIQPSGDAATDTKAIQAAINAGGKVELGEGTFKLNATLEMKNGVTLQGQGWEKTVIKQTAASKRCIKITQGSLIGVTVTGGNSSERGAGVHVADGSVSWCCISNNVSSAGNYGGGGVSFIKGSIDHSIVAYNKITGASFGGGIGGISDSGEGDVTIDTCLIYGNEDTAGSGGGLGFDRKNKNVTVRNCTIAGNKGRYNTGGVYMNNGSGLLVLINNIIVDNTANGSPSNVGVKEAQLDKENSKSCMLGTDTATVWAGGWGDKTLIEKLAANGFICDTPNFVDAAKNDYHLGEGSPAIGKGVTYDGIGNDLDNTAFVEPPSMGCYECGADPTVVKNPEFVPSAKKFYPTIEVTLTCATEDATIYYTIDGSEPTTSSAVYEGVIILSETTTIKARAFKDDLDPSEVVSATYTNKGAPVPSRLGSFRFLATFTVTKDVAGAAEGMPVLLKLSEDNPKGFKYDDCDPAEMRFGNEDFDPLPFEVDTWNPEGESLIWVKVPLAKDTEINFAYDGTAAEENDAAAVWSDYTGVWHFETLDTSVKVANSQGIYANSTATEGIDGNVSTYSIAGEEGRFGNCFRVNDSTGKQAGNYNKGGVWVNDAGANSPVDGGANFTISGWFKHGNFDYFWDHYFYKRSASGNTGSPNNAFAIEANSQAGAAQPLPRGSSGTGSQVGLSSNMKDTWAYITFAFDGAKCHVYENGAFKGDSGITACIDNDSPLIFGDNCAVATGGGDAAWNGWIDEVRFAKGTKSADFIAAEYAAMATDGLLEAGEVQELGPEVTVAPPKLFPASGTAFYPTTNVTITCNTEGATIRYTIDGTDPTESSDVYADEFAIAETMTVKARAFKDGLEPSVVVSATYECTEPIPPELGAVTVKPRMKGATISGVIESVGNLYATACDVYLAIGTREGDLGEPEKIATGVTGAFKYKVAGLTASTTYYYVLSVVNNATFASRAEKSGAFTTLETDVIEPGETPAETRQTIQDAIDDAAAEEESAGIVTLKAGLFEIDEQLIVKGGVTLVGQGWTNTVIKQTSVGGTYRCVTVRDGSKLVGVTLTGGAIGVAWQHGAGALVEDGTISWCCISNNATAKPNGNNNYGGGVNIAKGTIDHSIIACNTSAAAGGSSHGGGIGVNGPTGPVVIDTCLIYGNKAPNGSGGGIYANMGGQKLTVRNTTIANNETGGEAGGAYVSAGASNFEFGNSILADNVSGKGDVNLALSAANIVSQAFGNIFANGTAALGEGSASYPSSGEAWFVDMANGDCHLHASSPAADAGVWYEDIVDDLDGVRRNPEKMSAGCYECTEVDHGVIKLSPIDVTTTTTSATASGSISSLGEGKSATVTLRVGPNFDELTEVATATDIVSDFALTATDLTHATRYAYEITVENDVGRTATATGDFFTQYDPEIALMPSGDPAANVESLSVAFASAASTQGTVILGEGVFEIDAQLVVDGGITVVGQGWDKTILKQVAATATSNTRVMTIKGGSTVKGLTMTGGRLVGNWNHGAGAQIEDGTISWCCITNNQSTGNNIYGGGVNIATGVIDHSIVSGNTAGGSTSGGGGIGAYNSYATIVVDTCLVCGNSVPSVNNGGHGGGICFAGANPDVTIRNTTVVGNSTTGSGGGIDISTARVKLMNDIVWGNTVTAETENADVGGTPAEGSFGNLIGVDPLFRDAANGDYHVRAGSPAVAAGQWYKGVVEDLDGRKRGMKMAAGCYTVKWGLAIFVW